MTAKAPSRTFDRVTPVLFVFLWSSGWIASRYSAEYADPLTFLSVRYALAGLGIGAAALLVRAPWPARPAGWVHGLVAGVLLHAVYLGGVWWAIRHGLPASVSALLAAVQPIGTAVLGPSLAGERLSPRQWAGVAAGFCGLLLVLGPGLSGVDGARIGWAPVLVDILGMIGVTLGSFYQNRFAATGDLRTNAALQYAGAFLVTLPVAALLEPMRIEWNSTMVLVTAWSVVALSMGAIGLYLVLIRRGEVARSAQLIFLVPPTAALEAWALFGERFSLLQLLGFAVTAGGVVLATRRA